MCKQMKLNLSLSKGQCPLGGHENYKISNRKSVSGINNKIINKNRISTEYVGHFQEVIDVCKKSTSYKILTRTTQPAHLIVTIITIFVIFILWPNIVGEDKRHNWEENGLSLLFYIGGFSLHFGAQIWMTFVSGLALYFSLPRHIFGLCQQILFPKYYCMSSVLSITTLILYVKMIKTCWEFTSLIQTINLTLCAIIELTIYLYLAPPLLSLMHQKHDYEKDAGTGQEIGKFVHGTLINCTEYQKIHKTFRKVHMTIAIGNMITVGCTFLHLYYLTTKISLN